MKLNKIFITAVAAAAVLSMAACGSGSTGASTSGETAAVSAEGSTEGSTEGYTVEEMPVTTAAEAVTGATQTQAAANNPNNPVSKYAGAYTDENGGTYSLLIEPTDDVDNVYVTIGHIDNQDYYIWDIYGKIENGEIKYADAACFRLYPDDQSDTGAGQEVKYEDGTGTITISKEGQVTWQDDKENAGEGLVFVWDEALNAQLLENAAAGQY